MRAFVCKDFGPLDGLAPGELPQPVPGRGEVLLRVAAAGINYYDTLIVQGRYQLRPPLPFAPGGEVAGTVAALGEGVDSLVPGQRVVAFTSYGGCAEYVVAKASQTWALPEGVDFETAAAGLVTHGTVWFACHDLAALKSGETVLVLGAAGGVGLAAVHIAHAAGARVLAAARGADRLALCRAAGADALVDYSVEDLKARVKELTGGRGADVVVDPVGGDWTEAAVRALAWRGRLLVVGFASGAIPRLPANLLLLKGASASGVFWDEFLRREPAAAAAQIAAVLAGFASGRLRPVIGGRHTLEEAGDALAALAQRGTTGKRVVLLQPADASAGC